MKVRRIDHDDEPQGLDSPRFADPADGRPFGVIPPPSGSQNVASPIEQAPANEEFAFGCLFIGRDVNLTGTVSVPGTLRVEGRVDGKVEAAEIIVLPGGILVGEASCTRALLGGTLKGQIHCTEQLNILSTAQVEGEINYYKDIRVDAGATLNCVVTFSEAPAPMHGIAPSLDKIAPLVQSTTTFLAASERELVRDVVPMPASLMTRLFGSHKTH